MPVLVKYSGIVIRMLFDRTFGTHFHAFYGDCELVIGLNPVRVIQGEAPPWVREWALAWVGQAHRGLLSSPTAVPNAATPIPRHGSAPIAFAE